ncbi:MAG: HEAT repeat domain-containing protein [Planctomycetes bacterium]|nr:HEAT repeat domain-containing protein [Planctomycetota bacterium]
MRRLNLTLLIAIVLPLCFGHRMMLVSAAETGENTPTDKLSRLGEELEQADPERRCRALDELAEMGDAAQSAVPAMTKALQDDAPEVRGAAAMALGQIAVEPNDVLPKLIALLDDEGVAREYDGSEVGPSRVWHFAAIGAAGYGDKAVPYVIQLLKQDRSQLRMAASLIIIHLGPKAKDALPALTEALRSSDLDTRRPALMNAMLCLGTEAKPAMPLMREYLDDEDFHTQYWACRVLGAIGPEAEVAVPKLVSLLQGGVASVRRNAAIALGKIGPGIGDEALKALIAALKDLSQPVREQAAIALGRLGSFAEPAVPALEDVLKDDSDFAARSRAAEALYRLDPKSPTPFRVLLAQVQGEDEAEVAAHVLGEIGVPLGATDQLTALLEDPKPRSRIYAAWALGLMGKNTERATAVLEAFSDDPEPDYRNEAGVALDEIRARQKK